MKVDIATREDLMKMKQEIVSEITSLITQARIGGSTQELKKELLSEVKQYLKDRTSNPKDKEWLKAYEVRKLLSISNGTLQKMRAEGSIVFTRIGGLTFYRYEDIVKLMEDNKPQSPIQGFRKFSHS